MVYYPNGMELEVISEVIRGSVNHVFVCRDRLSTAGTMYTVLDIHDRACARDMLRVMEGNEKTGESPCLFTFSQNESLLFVFPYREERKFSAFAKGQVTSSVVGEEICINFVVECLSTGLPWPLLYLALDQDNVQIAKDNTVYFNYALDLAQLDPELRERACVVRCAYILMDLLTDTAGGGRSKRRRKLKSLELIRKKMSKKAYTGFPELYYDIKLTALPRKKVGLIDRIRGVWNRNRDLLFRILLVICVLLLLAATVMLVSQLIFGDIPLLRLFRNCFDVIGTENLHMGGRP